MTQVLKDRGHYVDSMFRVFMEQRPDRGKDWLSRLSAIETLEDTGQLVEILRFGFMLELQRMDYSAQELEVLIHQHIGMISLLERLMMLGKFFAENRILELFPDLNDAVEEVSEPAPIQNG